MKMNYKEVEDYRQYTSSSEIHKAVNSLIGILRGVKIDEVVNEEELEEVKHWCNMHRPFQTKFPFSEIIPLIDEALSDHLLTTDEIQDILWLCENLVQNGGFKKYYDVVTSSLQQFQGIIHGIMADYKLNEEEIHRLSDWMEDNDFLKGFYPFDEIHSLLTVSKKDGVISQDELNMFTAYFGNFIDSKSSYNINESEISDLQSKYSVGGICSVCPEISFENKIFSFTGTSSKATRSEIAEIIIKNGGVFNNNVTRSTHYLIVGNDGNPCWAFSCYGRKVEKAVQLRKDGSQVIIVHENDFWDELY